MFSSGPRGGGGMRGYNSFSGGVDDEDDEFGPFGGGGGGFRFAMSLVTEQAGPAA